MKTKTNKKIGGIFVIIGVVFLIYSIFIKFNWMITLGSIIMGSNGIKILYELRGCK